MVPRKRSIIAIAVARQRIIDRPTLASCGASSILRLARPRMTCRRVTSSAFQDPPTLLPAHRNIHQQTEANQDRYDAGTTV